MEMAAKRSPTLNSSPGPESAPPWPRATRSPCRLRSSSLPWIVLPPNTVSEHSSTSSTCAGSARSKAPRNSARRSPWAMPMGIRNTPEETAFTWARNRRASSMNARLSTSPCSSCGVVVVEKVMAVTFCSVVSKGVSSAPGFQSWTGVLSRVTSSR